VPRGTSFVAAGELLAVASGVARCGILATSAAGTTSTFAIPGGMASDRSSPGYDRVLERRRAVALARHFREAEDLSIGQIADRLGRSPATIKAYFYDPTGEKALAVKARYVGVCRGCGAYTQARNGKGDAYAFCKACHPGAIERRWTRERVLSAMWAWQARYGHLPSSYDWSLTHACRRGGVARERLIAGTWPSASLVTALFGRWAAARDAARRLSEEERPD
jgi:AraC-like DNA-binding protein